ncbi:MAG TPA: hypothetical protein VIS99_09200, partial [Terrimicrobiaceae bacterium]
RLLKSFGDYFVLNVSSPNTPGLRDLQQVDRLGEIIRILRTEAPTVPLLVKVAPDLPDLQALELAAFAENEGLAGLIATNTTVDHSSLPSQVDEEGGLSGMPLRERATNVLKIFKSGTSLPIIASGGVMDALAAKERFDAGAHLVQIYTGLIYHGPQLIREIADLSSKPSPSYLP